MGGSQVQRFIFRSVKQNAGYLPGIFSIIVFLVRVRVKDVDGTALFPQEMVAEKVYLYADNRKNRKV